jgi:hypothetical protein
MPPAAAPGRTEQFREHARERAGTGDHGVLVRILTFRELLRGRSDLPLYVGLAGRPAIVLCLSARMRAGLDGLEKRVRREGARLFLQGHRLGRYGLVRAVLELPEYELIFEAPLTLADGDVQEFLLAAYRSEVVELHLAHADDARSLGFTCRAAGIRPIVDAALEAVHGLAHPASAAEVAEPADALEARFPTVGDGLTGDSRVRLTVTGPAQDVVTMTATH